MALPDGFDTVIGEIIQQGTHDALVAADGFCYAPRLSAYLNTEHTMPARSREANGRLSAPTLACLFLGIFFIVQQVGHVP